MTGTADQCDVTGTAVGQPFGRCEAEAAGSANHDVPAVGVDWEGVDGRLRDAGLASRRYDDFSDMAGPLHQPECLGDMCPVENTMRKGREFTLGEEVDHFGEQLLRQCPVGADELVDVDAEIAQIAAQRPQTEMGVGVEVALAQFDEATERLQAIHGTYHRLAGQRVQDNVDTLAAGEAHHVLREREGAGIADEVGAEAAQQGPLLAAAGRRDDDCATMLCDLHGGQADRAGAAVDQNGFARLQPGKVRERIVGGEERDGQRRGVLE